MPHFTDHHYPNISKHHLPPKPSISQLQFIMDNNPFNENNNTNSGYVPPPPHVSPLYEAILPFYQPQNNYPPAYPPVYSPVYPPVPPETHQGNYTPTGVNWYNPPYVLESADLVPVTNLPANYLMNNSTGDTSVNTDQTNNLMNNSMNNYLMNNSTGNTSVNTHTNYLMNNSMNNYLMNNSTGDTSVNTDHTSFILNFEQSSGGEKQDLHRQVFQCEKCPSKFYSKHAFGGHMSAHSKQAKKINNVSQIMMAATSQSMSGANITGMNEGSNSSAAAASKKRGRKKGKNVVTDEPNAKKTVN